MSHFANALANANARISPPCSQKLITVVTLVTTTSFKALVGAQWLGLCPVSLMRKLTQTRDAPLALLAGESNSPQWLHQSLPPLLPTRLEMWRNLGSGSYLEEDPQSFRQIEDHVNLFAQLRHYGSKKWHTVSFPGKSFLRRASEARNRTCYTPMSVERPILHGPGD